MKVKNDKSIVYKISLSKQKLYKYNINGTHLK